MSRMHVSKFRTHTPQESDAECGPRILLYLQRDRHMLDSPRISPVYDFQHVLPICILFVTQFRNLQQITVHSSGRQLTSLHICSAISDLSCGLIVWQVIYLMIFYRLDGKFSVNSEEWIIMLNWKATIVCVRILSLHTLKNGVTSQKTSTRVTEIQIRVFLKCVFRLPWWCIFKLWFSIL